MAKKEIRIHGLLCERTLHGAILKIPTKDGGIKRFVTPLSGMKAFVDGRRLFMYFNEIIDDKEG